jgi:hypothetical protein
LTLILLSCSNQKQLRSALFIFFKRLVLSGLFGEIQWFIGYLSIDPNGLDEKKALETGM